MSEFGRLLLSFDPVGVSDCCFCKLPVKLFLVVIVPLEKIVFIVGGNCREEYIVDVFGE